jgi:hypothetical protein
VRLFALGTAVALVVIGMSESLMLSCAAFAIIGACNILTIAMLNVSVQLSAPRWVTARALSLFSSAITAGVGIGAVGWGIVAANFGLSTAIIASGVAVLLTVPLGFLMPLEADQQDLDHSSVAIGSEPEVAMDLTLRSGPVVVEIDYDVDPDKARDFYAVMMKMQDMRKRIGAFDWSIARDIANPAIWTEHYHCPTWGDYLRMRDRYTQADFDVQALADSFNREPGERRVRRRLERPFGSVRWKADSPDPHQETIGYIGP